MIVQLNTKNQIIAAFEDGLIEADNKTSFKVKHFNGFIAGKIPYYDLETGRIYYKNIQSDPAKKEAAITRANQLRLARAQKEAALQWLADNDWKVNKRTVGEWAEDDPRRLEYLAGRAKARAQYDEAVAILTQK
jgi:hypothetical protein